jgi:signal transduction histidine kinase
VEHNEYLEKRNGIVALAFEESEQPMLVIDPSGHIVLASDGAGVLLGEARASLIGKDLRKHFLRPEILDECREAWHSGSTENRTLEVMHSQGDIRVVEARCRAFDAEPLIVNGVEFDDKTHGLLVLTDVQRRQAQDEKRMMRLAKLSLLNQVSEALYGAHLTLDQILQAVLICITSGQGLGFNRAFLLLIDENNLALQGELAIGPSDAEEATRIWLDLADKQVDLFEMMTSYDQSIKTTDTAVNNLVRRMSVPLDASENLLIKSMVNRQVVHITKEMVLPGADSIRNWLGSKEFALAPLMTRRGPLGVIVADNAISHANIGSLDLEFLHLFANQSAGAIENNRLYRELEKRLIDLRKAHEQQKEDQATLLRMERLSVMGETSAIVAHELRNPLVAIGGFARTLVRSLAEDDPNHEFARIISDEVGRMERIIHDLLDFIRPRKQMRKSIVLDELINDTVKAYQMELQEKKIDLRLDLQVNQTPLNCNPGEIQQVLQNYVLNAIQMMPDGGELEISSRVLEGGIKISVNDSGPGFADDVNEKLFSPFFSTKPTGSGLGLTICSQIVKSHGGVIGATNRDTGGAEFYFILPLPK